MCMDQPAMFVLDFACDLSGRPEGREECQIVYAEPASGHPAHDRRCGEAPGSGEARRDNGADHGRGLTLHPAVVVVVGVGGGGGSQVVV